MLIPITRFPVPGIQGSDVDTRPPQDRAALGPPQLDGGWGHAHKMVFGASGYSTSGEARAAGSEAWQEVASTAHWVVGCGT